MLRKLPISNGPFYGYLPGHQKYDVTTYPIGFDRVLIQKHIHLFLVSIDYKKWKCKVLDHKSTSQQFLKILLLFLIKWTLGHLCLLEKGKIGSKDSYIFIEPRVIRME